MGRGRAPCCDKSKVKKGPWSPAEDLTLISFIQKQGHANWRALPKQAGLLRCGKSCRLRWINYLRPDVRRGNFSPEEEETIINLHNSLGNKWSKIASHLPGRTDNEIKNVWNTSLKKRLIIRNDANCHQVETKDSSTSYSASPSPSSGSCISYGDLNLDKGPGGKQEGQETNVDQRQDQLLTRLSGESKSIDEPMQASISPRYSYASNIQNFSQVEVLRPVEATTSLNNCNANTLSEVQNTMTEKNKDIAANEMIEISSESDIDFWNMFDSFDSIDSNESQPQEYEIYKSSNLAEDHQEEVECKKWLRYLENELGLVGGIDGDRTRNGADQQQQLLTKATEDEMMLRPEFDPAKGYFSMWPSSPQNLGI